MAAFYFFSLRIPMFPFFWTTSLPPARLVMARRGYERIDSKGGDAPARASARGVAVALAACAAFAAYMAPHATKVAAVQSLYRVGHALESAPARGTLLAAEDADVTGCPTCACAETGDVAVDSMESVALATAAPTETKYWELFWTDGSIGGNVDDSYVWWTNEQLEGVRATILVDTFGYAKGVDIDSNATTVYFTVDGCVARVHTDGYELKEILCYSNDDDAAGSVGMQGLALYEFDNKMYWVDSNTNTLYGANLEDAGEYWVVSDGFYQPVDVAVDERAAAIYVTDGHGMYKMDQDGSDRTLILSENDKGLSGFKGVDIDAMARTIYFSADDTVYYADIFDPSTTYTKVYEGLTDPMGVAVDGTEELLFFIDTTGIYRGDLTGAQERVYVAEVADARFCAILAESAPTPAPTPLPSSAPTDAPIPQPTVPPTSAPTSKPTREPTPLPTSAPSEAPTPAPVPVPTSVPTSKPTALPSMHPTFLPTAYPTPSPTALPSSAPSSKPTDVPVPVPTAVPTSLPTTQCWIEMNKCGYCDGSAGWECVGEAPPTHRPTTGPAGSPTFKPTANPAGAGPAPTVGAAVVVSTDDAAGASDDAAAPSDDGDDATPAPVRSNPPTFEATDPPTKAPTTTKPSASPVLAPTTSKYVFTGSEKMSWDSCKTACLDAGRQMACVRSAAENADIMDILEANNHFDAWLGYESPTDEDSSNTANWAWNSGCVSTYTNWATGEPNDYGSGEDYAHIYATSGEWNDAAESYESYCYCSKATFVRFSTGATFETCKDKCEADGWMMPCVTDATDNAELEAIMDAGSDTNGWLGYESPSDSDSADTSTWTWISDSCTSTYTDWSTGEPNDYGTGEDCAEIYAYKDGVWNDADCSIERACYCQPA